MPPPFLLMRVLSKTRLHRTAGTHPVPPRRQPLAGAAIALGLGLFSAGAAAAAEPADDGAVEQVVITAQKRPERLQDVAAPVKAFSARQIAAAGIAGTRDFANLTPNMAFDESFTYGNSFVVLRGVTQINNADAPVVVVVDGVPQGNQKQLRMQLFDIERIEVLKGPQGALYGRNAIGGAINIETRAPGPGPEGFAAASYGSGGTRELSAAVGGASAGEGAAFRIAALARRSAGRLTNPYLQRTVDAVDRDDHLRARLTLRAGDGVRVDLRAAAADVDAGATYDSIVADGNPATIVAPRSNVRGRTLGRTRETSARVDVELPAGVLTAIAGATDLREGYRGDVDFSNPVDLPAGFLGLGFQAGQGQDLDVRLRSQELRLSSPADRPLRWIAGVYHLDTRRRLDTRAFIDTDASHAQYDDPAKVIVELREDNRNRASAVFGQLDVDFARHWTLAAALRRDRDRRQQTDLRSGDQRRRADAQVQPKLTLTRRLDAHTLVYASLGKGFRSGGFNAPGIPDFRAETLVNAELGHKLVALDGRLTLNTALFTAHSKDFQYFRVDATRLAQIIANIDRVRLAGLDVDWRWRAARSLEIDGGLGLTDSNIRRNTAEPDTVGRHTPRNVPFKLNLGAQYTLALGRGVLGSARLDWEHRARKYWHPDNQAVAPALDLLGLRIGVRDPADRWSLTLAARNLTDRQYYADFNARKYSGLPYDIGWRADGRTLALEGRWRI